MYCTAERKAIEEIRTSEILPQTPFWARMKDRQGYRPSGFEITVSRDLINRQAPEQETVTDDLLVLLKELHDDRCIAYVPYGPRLEPENENQGVMLETLSEVIREHLPSNCVFIRYDLMWENIWAGESDYYDREGNWTGPPPPHTQEMRMNFNTTRWRLRKSPMDILPKNTFFLDLNQNERELLSSMRFNTRYNIRRAFRQGVEVMECGAEGVDDWYHLYRDTARRNHMPLQQKSFFSNIMESQDEQRNGVRVKLLMALFQGEAVASMFLLLSAGRGNYLYGASSSHHRRIMASYALQWEAIKRCRNLGCSEYDLFGCAPNLDDAHPLHGVHVFKKGFGGHLYHRMGCWDYLLTEDGYSMVNTIDVS